MPLRLYRDLGSLTKIPRRTTNVLLWMEYLATKRKLRVVTRTAKNLETYLNHRVELSPFDPQQETLKSWINDLIRLSNKFSANINIMPSSINTLIPPMCPSESTIRRTYKPRHPGIEFRGLGIKYWNDCLGRIEYPHLTVAVAYGNRYSAVATSDGTNIALSLGCNTEKGLCANGLMVWCSALTANFWPPAVDGN